MRSMMASKGTSISSTTSSFTPASFMASAWAIVRGKPSKRKPFVQSGCSRRSLTRPMMMSSPTRPPESITCLAARPMAVPAFTAARSMSPVEICGIPKRWQMKVACVPLPAPGAPRSISLIAVLGCLVVMRRHRACLPLADPLESRIARDPWLLAYPEAHRARTRARSCGVSTPGPGGSSLTCTAMRKPCHSTRSCSSDSTCSSGDGGSAGKPRRKPAR